MTELEPIVLMAIIVFTVATVRVSKLIKWMFLATVAVWLTAKLNKYLRRI